MEKKNEKNYKNIEQLSQPTLSFICDHLASQHQWPAPLVLLYAIATPTNTSAA